MSKPKGYRPLSCAECQSGKVLDFDFTMAFQPIVDITTQTVFAEEALARTLTGGSAYEVFKHVNDDNQYLFDQTCRVKAIKLASQLGITSCISINFMPNAIYIPEACIRTTLEAAKEFDFPIDRIIFEFTEVEQVRDVEHLRGIIEYYQKRGFSTAIDDFGSGYSGLNLLAQIDTNILKIDMALIRDIDTKAKKQAIVRGIVSTCNELSIKVVAEGVETQAEFEVLENMGITLYQGYYFAKPCFEGLAEPVFP